MAKSSTKKKGGDEIAAYAEAQSVEFAAICQALRKSIDAAMPSAASKIWHALPVWFLGETPVVGYKATDKYVNLLFWNGQAFDEPALIAAGKFRAAQIKYTALAQVDPVALQRWLRKAKTDLWDYRTDLAEARRAAKSKVKT